VGNFKNLYAHVGTAERMNSISIGQFAPSYGFEVQGKVAVEFIGPYADSIHEDDACVAVWFEADDMIPETGAWPGEEKSIVRKGKVVLPVGFLFEMLAKALTENRYKPDEAELKSMLVAIARSLDGPQKKKRGE